MKNVLVTGGAGFIGSHLVKSLIDQNINVKVLDNLSSGNRKNASKNVKLILGNILDIFLLEKIAAKCDTVFHFASLTNVQESLLKPEKYFSNNYIGTVNVVKTCVKYKLNLIFASSSAVYPQNIKNKSKEKDSSYPENAYGLSKKLSEEYILINKKKLKSFTIFRFFNVYGKKQSDKSFYSAVIPKFIKNAKKNSYLELYNKGSQSRDFVYVDDVVELCIKAGKKRTNKILNLGTGKSTQIKKLANLIKDILNNGKIKNGTFKENDAKYSCANIKKLKNIFPRKEFVPLSVGLRKIIYEK